MVRPTGKLRFRHSVRVMAPLWWRGNSSSNVARLERYLAWYERRLRMFPNFAGRSISARCAGRYLESTQFPGDWCPANKVAGSYWNATLANASLDPYAKNLGEAQCGQVDLVSIANLISPHGL